MLSKKHDGSLRDEYETYLYAETQESITLFSLPGLKYWDHRKEAWLESQDGLIEIYFKQKWFNVFHVCEQISQTNLIYVNIAMPVIRHESAMVWIDLDLDYRVHLHKSVGKLDQIEFEQNAQLMGYPADVLQTIELACQEVEAGLTSRTYPFDHERQVSLYHEIKGDLLDPPEKARAG